MTTKILGLLAVALLAGPMAANAVPVTWSLSGNLTQGGSVSGSFVYDADTSLFSYISMTSSLTGNVYSDFFGWGFLGPTFGQAGVAPGTSTTALWLQDLSQSELTNTGGTISKSFNFGAIAEVRCSAPCQTGGSNASNWRGYVLTGVPTTVPEPGTLALLGLGLAGLGLSRRRKTN